MGTWDICLGAGGRFSLRKWRHITRFIAILLAQREKWTEPQTKQHTDVLRVQKVNIPFSTEGLSSSQSKNAHHLQPPTTTTHPLEPPEPTRLDFHNF